MDRVPGRAWVETNRQRWPEDQEVTSPMPSVLPQPFSPWPAAQSQALALLSLLLSSTQILIPIHSPAFIVLFPLSLLLASTTLPPL